MRLYLPLTLGVGRAPNRQPTENVARVNFQCLNRSFRRLSFGLFPIYFLRLFSATGLCFFLGYSGVLDMFGRFFDPYLKWTLPAQGHHGRIVRLCL